VRAITRLRRTAALLAAGLMTSLLLPITGAWAQDYDYPIDDPVDCQMYGGWDVSWGIYCGEEPDNDWIDNDIAYVENAMPDPTPIPSPSASPSPTPTPTPTPSPSPSPGNGNGKGKGPKK
jgi:hypothetical protein